MPLTTPATLDADIDVMLDDLPDVPATLRALRADRPAVWARAFGEPALLLLSHALVNDAFRDKDTPGGRVLQPRRHRRSRQKPAMPLR